MALDGLLPAWVKRILGQAAPRRFVRGAPVGAYRDQMSGTTCFFRNYPQFLALTRAVRAAWPPGTRLDVLHVGGSVGCEALSFIIVMREREPSYELHVLSTDVDGESLEGARSFRYDARWFEPILGEGGSPDEVRAKWFAAHREHDRLVYVPDVRITQRLDFAALDISAPEQTMSADIVFCQNVLIHMDRPLAERCLQNALRLLRSPSLLVCGGMDLDLRSAIRNAGLRPITDSIREIHEAWSSHRFHFRNDRGRHYFELEDLDEARPDWTTRYCSIFAKD